MRVLILSDIHANRTALEAVLHAAGQVDATWCLGDVVGYGPSPNECVALLKEQPNLVCLRGNHDAAAIGDLALDSFNPEARASLEWMRDLLDEATVKFLKSCPSHTSAEGFTLVHASPRQPMLEYLLDTHAAAENFDYFDTDHCFVGHTHVPVEFKMNPNTNRVSLHTLIPNTAYALKPRSIINPGSVGQPRDRDPRAAFAILDTGQGKWHHQRVEYDIPSVQKLMRAAHLPQRHVQRLETGW
ncbi:MAG: metallophosphoesterase [Chloroflexi bacterium]|nr:metallophosphoesterase [Chloroflexota bacterium]